jgi:amidohydrolase
VTEVKARARERVEKTRDELVALSHRIHAHPEVMWEEHRSSAWTSAALERGGFSVSPVDGLPTAFVARAGSGPLHVGICAEYDALPGVGHACGHNVIAAAAVGAGLALADVADGAGLTVTVFGTPAEEGGGGKIEMLDRGLFDDEHLAMMVHPASIDDPAPGMIAAQHLVFRFTGREAHAAASPELGVNAADALTIGQVALGLLRQHVRRTDMMHGIVTHGGDAPNIVPAHTEARYIVRSSVLEDLEALVPRVIRCFEAGALATGATISIEQEPAYAEVRSDPDLASLWRRNAEAIGRAIEPPEALAGRFPASTDFGNVSRRMPAIHPLIGIETNGAGNHQPAFAAACARPSADRAVADGAVLLAWTALDAATDETIRRRLTG